MGRSSLPIEFCSEVKREESRRPKGIRQRRSLEIVWAYHTAPQSTTRETPFSLVYGSDAMILVEIQENSPRFQNFVAEESNKERKVNLDVLDEVRRKQESKPKP